LFIPIKILSQNAAGVLHFPPLPLADLQDAGVIAFVQGRVSRVPRIFVGVVAAGVVTSNEGPPRVGTLILVRSMQKIAMEKNRRAGIQFAMDELQPRENGLDALLIGDAGLVADFAVIDPPQKM
jgi:hypothetical protein